MLRQLPLSPILRGKTEAGSTGRSMVGQTTWAGSPWGGDNRGLAAGLSPTANPTLLYSFCFWVVNCSVLGSSFLFGCWFVCSSRFPPLAAPDLPFPGLPSLFPTCDWFMDIVFKILHRASWGFFELQPPPKQQSCGLRCLIKPASSPLLFFIFAVFSWDTS